LSAKTKQRQLLHDPPLHPEDYVCEIKLKFRPSGSTRDSGLEIEYETEEEHDMLTAKWGGKIALLTFKIAVPRVGSANYDGNVLTFKECEIRERTWTPDRLKRDIDDLLHMLTEQQLVKQSMAAKEWSHVQKVFDEFVKRGHLVPVGAYTPDAMLSRMLKWLASGEFEEDEGSHEMDEILVNLVKRRFGSSSRGKGKGKGKV